MLSGLLIEPLGIETTDSRLSFAAVQTLLIEPLGIETREVERQHVRIMFITHAY